MRNILLIVQKEFLQIFRNKAMLPLLTIMPVVQLFLLSYAASHEVRNIRLSVFDADKSSFSRLLVNKISASGYFILSKPPVSVEKGQELLDKDIADIVMNIPVDFERDFYKNREIDLQLLINSINGTKATLGAAYLGSIIQGFQKEIMPSITPMAIRLNQGGISLTESYWYNPELDYKTFMVPGILGVLVTILSMMLAAMNLVREREIGTVEQVNVTPIKKYEFLSGKLIPFLIIGLVNLAFGLTVGKLAFDIPVEGSLLLLFGFCVVQLVAVLGLGLFISTFADTQQQAMFIAWFFMVIFILMGGLFTPIESMPEWAQWLTVPNPIAHFVEVMRRVLLKGSSFIEIQYHFWMMIGLGVVFNLLAVRNYRKTAG